MSSFEGSGLWPVELKTFGKCHVVALRVGNNCFTIVEYQSRKYGKKTIFVR
jgi:hypothetical protein